METIIDAVSSEDIIKELTEERFVRKTNYGHNEIYIVNAHNAPNTMREIGRLRELAFRESGGGTGKSMDIDEFDTRDDVYFEQLIVWDPAEKEILGGYRFIDCKQLNIKNNGQVDTPTSELFYYSEDFIKDYLPHTIELGRSFIQPKYQSTGNVRKSIFTLDNLWDGLGALLTVIPSTKYFFGKVTMYSQYDPALRDMIIFFMKKFFPDNDKLVYPYPDKAINIKARKAIMKLRLDGNNYQNSYRTLSKYVRENGSTIPPLFNAYMSLSATMKTFGTALNEPFGNVEETAILITIEDIFPEKIERHLIYNKNEKPEHLKQIEN